MSPDEDRTTKAPRKQPTETAFVTRDKTTPRQPEIPTDIFEEPEATQQPFTGTPGQTVDTEAPDATDRFTVRSGEPGVTDEYVVETEPTKKTRATPRQPEQTAAPEAFTTEEEEETDEYFRETTSSGEPGVTDEYVVETEPTKKTRATPRQPEQTAAPEAFTTEEEEETDEYFRETTSVPRRPQPFTGTPGQTVGTEAPDATDRFTVRTRRPAEKKEKTTAPLAVTGIKVPRDLVLILDSSDNVSPDDFENMRVFARRIVESSDIDGSGEPGVTDEYVVETEPTKKTRATPRKPEQTAAPEAFTTEEEEETDEYFRETTSVPRRPLSSGDRKDVPDVAVLVTGGEQPFTGTPGQTVGTEAPDATDRFTVRTRRPAEEKEKTTAPVAVTGIKVPRDLVLILDSSDNVSPDDFENMRVFARRIVESSDIDGSGEPGVTDEYVVETEPTKKTRATPRKPEQTAAPEAFTTEEEEETDEYFRETTSVPRRPQPFTGTPGQTVGTEAPDATDRFTVRTRRPAEEKEKTTAPVAVTGIKVPRDLVLILDSSDNVSPDDFENMRVFARRIVESSDIDGSGEPGVTDEYVVETEPTKKTRATPRKPEQTAAPEAFTTEEEEETDEYFRETTSVPRRPGLLTYGRKTDIPFQMNRRGISVYGVGVGLTNTRGDRKDVPDVAVLVTGGEGDRKDVPDVAVLVTGGESSVNTEWVVPAARTARQRGISVYGVGIESRKPAEEISTDLPGKTLPTKMLPEEKESLEPRETTTAKARPIVTLTEASQPAATPTVQTARQRGISVYGVGVGLTNTRELREVVSQPVGDYIFTVRRSQSLPDVQDPLISAVFGGSGEPGVTDEYVVETEPTKKTRATPRQPEQTAAPEAFTTEEEEETDEYFRETTSSGEPGVTDEYVVETEPTKKTRATPRKPEQTAAPEAFTTEEEEETDEYFRETTSVPRRPMMLRR
ncbi:proteoglycan 4-like [Liolophura sinensis]|uniref:proteoglycan 4-like n=1 Tax=Liolophura sinensis TaxID=3198878 RepID=UPI00315899C0